MDYDLDLLQARALSGDPAALRDYTDALAQGIGPDAYVQPPVAAPV
jgi:hypothetical protein